MFGAKKFTNLHCFFTPRLVCNIVCGVLEGYSIFCALFEKSSDWSRQKLKTNKQKKEKLLHDVDYIKKSLIVVHSNSRAARIGSCKR